MGDKGMRDKIKLTREQGIELFDEGRVDDFVMVDEENEIIGKGRWSVRYNALVKNDVTGDMYILPYSVGATESQDEGLFEYMDAILTPAKSVTIQKWIVDDNK